MGTLPETWMLIEDRFDVANNRHFEALLALGSGPLQQRASLEEGLADDPQNREYARTMRNVTAEQFPDFKGRLGTYLPGVTGPHPTCRDEMINLPATHGLQLSVADEQLDMERSRIERYRRWLDLRRGRLHREFEWLTKSGSVIGVEFERFISAARQHVMALRCRLRHLDGPQVEIHFRGTLDADVRTNGFDHFESVSLGEEHSPITVAVRTNGGDVVAAAALLRCEPAVELTCKNGPRLAVMAGKLELETGAQAAICKYAAFTSSRHITQSPMKAVREFVAHAEAIGFDALAAESDAVWHKRWEQTDVEIEGNPRDQLALRSSLYHLLRSVSENDPQVAIDPKAGVGEAYCGRYFWDTDIFMLPLFLYTRPAVGRTLAEHRIITLDAARRNARRLGYSGAAYAWEAAPDGSENCPNWQYAEHEIHVTADVGYALWHAFLVDPTDCEFLAGVTEVLTETARYWSERVTYSEQLDQYEMLMVMGPDEYTPFSRNNAFTNRMVAYVLELTRTAWQQLFELKTSAAEHLQLRLEVTEAELDRYRDISEKMRIPYDPQRRLVLQSDDFFDYEPIDLERVWWDRTRPLAATVSQEKLYRSRVLKQADVIQLLALFPHEFDREQMRVAYETYEPLTTHDSSLSKSIHSLVAAWIGKPAEALRFWDESVGLDLTPPKAAEGIHAACCGSNWQVAVFGFGGVRTRMQSDLLQIEPHLPQRWKSLRFPLVWRGQQLRILIDHERIEVEHHGNTRLEAKLGDKEVTLEPGRKTAVLIPDKCYVNSVSLAD